jgi:hypothetical protein
MAATLQTITLIEDHGAVAEILPARFHRSPTAPEPMALSPARDRLRAAIARLARLQREAEEAAAPVRRFHDVIAEHARLSAHLVDCYREDRTALADLIASGDPRRTVTSHETIRTNERILALDEAKAAAEMGLPAAEVAHRTAVEKLRAATAERDLAICDVLIEIDNELGKQETEKLNEALAIRAQRVSICAESQQQNTRRGDNVYLATANRIIDGVRASQAAAAAPHDPDFGRLLIEQLATDPGAGLLP